MTWHERDEPPMGVGGFLVRLGLAVGFALAVVALAVVVRRP